MWRLKQLIPKEQSGLEGKTVEVGSLKLQIRSIIAQGGFSSVYLARDPQSGKLYALKHIICNDSESLDLVKKEVNALKSLRGHPNVVTLHSQSMYDMGRTKECFIVTEYCEKMLVDYLDNRGAGYLDEKQLLIMFRDVCNAVYAMHSQSPPMAHRDLKAENLLLGSDGQWKLCDFGSISTNHKRFEKASEMGIEEDIIRKHTTPAYRAPEMWDLYTREMISEKVDIWALGCLLYRMAYFKSAFDGESKLQILNGNYRIPDLPKYSANVTGLIRDMLNSSPEERPDALQVWQRVNGALPRDCQKTSPDRAPSAGAAPHSIESAGHTSQSKSSSVIPSRSPPPPPQRSFTDRSSSPAVKEADLGSASAGGKGGGLGSFWSSQYAQDAVYDGDSSTPATKGNHNTNSQPAYSKSPVFDDDKSSPARSKISNPTSQPPYLSKSTLYDDDRSSPSRNKTGYPANSPLQGPQTVASPKSVRTDAARQRGSRLNEEGYNDNDINTRGSSNVGHTQTTSRDDAFNEFVADFQKMSSMATENKVDGGSLQAELDSLRNELKQVQREKQEITAKYEKLTAICRSQRLEIQELKSSFASSNNQSGASQAQKPDKQGGTIWDLQDGLKTSTEPQAWKAFDDGPSKKLLSGKKDFQEFSSARYESSRSDTRWMNDSSSKQSGDVWGLHDSFASLGNSGFTATRPSGQGSQGDKGTGYDSKGSLRSTTQTKPSGWSNF